MFPTRKQILPLKVDGHVIRPTAGHPFYTTNGWVDAGDLRAGDLLRTRDGSWASVQSIEVEQRPVHQLVPGIMPAPSSGLLPAGTLIQTAAGLKAVEDIKVGDHVVVPSPERNGSLERTKSSPALFVRSLTMLAETVTVDGRAALPDEQTSKIRASSLF